MFVCWRYVGHDKVQLDIADDLCSAWVVFVSVARCLLCVCVFVRYVFGCVENCVASH